MSGENVTTTSKLSSLIYLFRNETISSTTGTANTTYQVVPTSVAGNWSHQYSDDNFNVLLWATIDCCLCIVTLTGNILTITSITFSRKLSNVVSNLFILSLATSDLLVGLVTPYHMAFYLDPRLGKNFTLCMIKLGLMSLACIASLCNIISIAIDRYIAIVYPLQYNKLITKKTARIISSIAWLMAITIATAPVYWNEWQTKTETKCELGYVLSPYYVLGLEVPAFVLMFILMSVIYFKIVREANKHAKRLRKNNRIKTYYPDCWKSVNVLMMVMGFFTISYTPYLMTLITNTVFGVRTGYTSTVYKISNSLAMANSAFNPVIYAWKNREIKHVFSRLLHCKSVNTNSTTDITTSTKDNVTSFTTATNNNNNNRPQSLSLVMTNKSDDKRTIVRSFSLNTIHL